LIYRRKERLMKNKVKANAVNKKTTPVTVFELGVGRKYTFTGLSPIQALISAYALSIGDSNTWDYEKYEKLVKEGKYGYHLENFSTQRLFIGGYPEGILFADRQTEESGDYKKVGFLSYQTLKLEIYEGCPQPLIEPIKEYSSILQKRRGEQYEVSTSGQTVTLEWGLSDE
jgi:hypothetical protein